MMAGAEDPATLSGFCHPMAIAMADGVGTSSQRNRCDGRLEGGRRREGLGLRSRLEFAGSHGRDRLRWSRKYGVV